MLGDVAERLDDDDEKSSKMIQKMCDNTTVCYKGLCSCMDPMFDCDCKLDYVYVRDQPGAGCDGIDSDGDEETMIDVCEDRYAPSIILLNSGLFISHKREMADFSFTDEVFLTHEHVQHLFNYQVRVDDDCAVSKMLTMKIEHVGGTCNNTTYELTPIQNYTECNDRTTGTIGKDGEPIPFTNPLSGKSLHFIVNVDEEAPMVECGFHEKSDSDIIGSKTLFKYPTNERDVVNSNFYYRIEVCRLSIKYM